MSNKNTDGRGVFEWKMTKNLTFFQIILAFLLPSIIAFFGFRLVLPSLVSNGYPKVLMWGIVAIIMLFVLVAIGILLNKYDAKKLKISLKERLCINKISGKQWLICFGIMIIGLMLSMTVKPVVEPITRIPGFSIPDYMPFWLNPTIDVVNTDVNILSPGYPLKGNYILLILMAFALLLNILAEEIYFRAWLLPKMQCLVNGVGF
ncbi:MAG: hypothetical protein IPO21_16560 [Bacteroidales bacterium]|nr:hypothetical protein [Bacteroidales bacterium]